MNKRAKSNSYWRQTWQQYKKSPLAMVALAIFLLLILCALFADVIAPYDYAAQNPENSLLTPNREYLFGTDQYGRDMLSRIIMGSRVSLLVCVVAVSIGVAAGVIFGGLAAVNKRLDNPIMRCMDILMGVPSMLMAIAIINALGSGVFNMMVAVGLSTVPKFARIVRSSVLTVRESEFIEAERCLGASQMRIMMRHILPNAFAPILVQATLSASSAIIWTSTLSFLGLGIKPPSPEWGCMLSEGRGYIRDAWHMCVIPGLAVMITSYSLNLIGDGLRDALDPRLRR